MLYATCLATLTPATMVAGTPTALQILLCFYAAALVGGRCIAPVLRWINEQNRVVRIFETNATNVPAVRSMQTFESRFRFALAFCKATRSFFSPKQQLLWVFVQRYHPYFGGYEDQQQRCVLYEEFLPLVKDGMESFELFCKLGKWANTEIIQDFISLMSIVLTERY